MPKAKSPLDPFKDLPFDAKAVEDAFSSAADLNQKLAAKALDAASAAQDVNEAWAKDTLGKLAGLTTAKPDPADYFKTLTDVITAQSDVAMKNVTALSDIAKAYQTETFALITAAGKTMSEDAAKKMATA